ncbi:MAG: hypothetical protein GY794_11505, partial [bacterium]|nr:hypothetical protein [bacterium]
EIIRLFVESPDIVESMTAPGKLDFDKKVRLHFSLTAFARIREHLWFQYRDGILDESSWDSYRRVIPFIFGTTRTRQYWKSLSEPFDPEFVAMVDGLLESSPPADDWWRDFEAMS